VPKKSPGKFLYWRISAARAFRCWWRAQAVATRAAAADAGRVGPGPAGGLPPGGSRRAPGGIE
jgi:hypothetical protein